MILDSVVKRMPLESLRSGWIGPAVEAAENCTKCGECEEKCPYGLPIREMMDERIAL
jgi:predicted aldo/keto reductase-like oxidoreductase